MGGALSETQWRKTMADHYFNLTGSIEEFYREEAGLLKCGCHGYWWRGSLDGAVRGEFRKIERVKKKEAKALLKETKARIAEEMMSDG